jgi:hypothetical protein
MMEGFEPSPRLDNLIEPARRVPSASIAGTTWFQRLLRKILWLTIAQSVALAGSSAAMASCNAPNFATIPLRLAVISSPDSLQAGSDLRQEIDLINAHQSNYNLVAVPSTEFKATLIEERKRFDAVLVFDPNMMDGDRPTYNDFLVVNKSKDLSDQTMIVDYRFDSDKRIVHPFLQIAATAAKIRPLLMEVALMALADFKLIQDPEFLDYYYALDRLASRDDDSIRSGELDDILRSRERIVKACFLPL